MDTARGSWVVGPLIMDIQSFAMNSRGGGGVEGVINPWGGGRGPVGGARTGVGCAAFGNGQGRGRDESEPLWRGDIRGGVKSRTGWGGLIPDVVEVCGWGYGRRKSEPLPVLDYPPSYLTINRVNNTGSIGHLPRYWIPE
eukprot:758155-Hanusia_phi.AAC.1